MGLARSDVARMIDHTLLRPDAGAGDIGRLCAEARRHRFGHVCVNPVWVAQAKGMLEGSGVGVVTVVDFPLGAGGAGLKRDATRLAVAEGADELDMVIPIGSLRAGDDETVAREIGVVVEAAQGRPVKAILETALLTAEQIDRGCRAAARSGAVWVKTSTGFGPGGATVEAVLRMRAAVPAAIGVKASGGIRDAATARAMLEAGAGRLGTSASVAILSGWVDGDE